MSDRSPPPPRPATRPVRRKNSEDFDFGEPAPPPRPAVRPQRRQSAKPNEVSENQDVPSGDKPASDAPKESKSRLLSQLEKMDTQASSDPGAAERLGFDKSGKARVGSDAETYVTAVASSIESPGGTLSQGLGLPVLGPRKAYGSQPGDNPPLYKGDVSLGDKEEPTSNEHSSNEKEILPEKGLQSEPEALGKSRSNNQLLSERTPTLSEDQSPEKRSSSLDESTQDLRAKTTTSKLDTPADAKQEHGDQGVQEVLTKKETKEEPKIETQVKPEAEFQGKSEIREEKNEARDNVETEVSAKDEPLGKNRKESETQDREEAEVTDTETVGRALSDGAKDSREEASLSHSPAAGKDEPPQANSAVEINENKHTEDKAGAFSDTLAEPEAPEQGTSRTKQNEISSDVKAPKATHPESSAVSDEKTRESKEPSGKPLTDESIKDNLRESKMPPDTDTSLQDTTKKTSNHHFDAAETAPGPSLGSKITINKESEHANKKEDSGTMDAGSQKDVEKKTIKSPLETKEDHPKPPPRPSHRPKLAAASRFESALRESENAAPKPRPKPNVSGRIGQLRSSLFADLNSALEKGQKSAPSFGRRSEVERSTTDSKETSESEGTRSVKEESADAQLHAMTANPRARMRGPKRRLPTEAKQKWSTVIFPLWRLDPKVTENASTGRQTTDAAELQGPHQESALIKDSDVPIPERIDPDSSYATKGTQESPKGPAKEAVEEPLAGSDEGNRLKSKPTEVPFKHSTSETDRRISYEGKSGEHLGDKPTEEHLNESTDKSDEPANVDIKDYPISKPTQNATESDISSEEKPEKTVANAKASFYLESQEPESAGKFSRSVITDKPSDGAYRRLSEQTEPQSTEREMSPTSESDSFKGSDTSLRRAVAAAISNKSVPEHPDICADTRDIPFPKLASLLDKPSESRHSSDHIGINVGEQALTTGLAEDLLRPPSGVSEQEPTDPNSRSQEEPPLELPSLSHYLDKPRPRGGSNNSSSKMSDISFELPEAPAPPSATSFDQAPPPRPTNRPSAQQRLERARKRIRERQEEHAIEDSGEHESDI